MPVEVMATKKWPSNRRSRARAARKQASASSSMRVAYSRAGANTRRFRTSKQGSLFSCREEILQRRHTQPLRFEQAFQVFSRVDQSPGSQDAGFVDQRRERQPAHLIGHAERRGQNVGNAGEALGAHILAVFFGIAVACEDDVEPIAFLFAARFD